MSTTKPARQPRLDAVFQQRQRRYRSVGRYHYLPVRHVQRVERVEEALLRLLLAYQELNVVQQQNVLVAEAVAEVIRRPLAYRLDVGIGELLGSGVYERQPALGEAVSDGVHQVSLSETDVGVHD